MLDEFWDTATPDDLPGDLAEIGHLLGMDAARYFALHWSGSWPYIAAHRERSADLDEIAYALGEEAVQTLIDAFGGNQLYIASFNSLRKRYAWHVIKQEFDGRNAGALAARLQVPRRYVMEVVTSDAPPEHDRPRKMGPEPGPAAGDGAQLQIDF